VSVLDTDGAVLSQQRYLPFGQVRTDVGGSNPLASYTDMGYTFQRDLDAQGATFEIGLMDYKARFYGSGIMRFTQPDSIVPSAGNLQAFNRYSYANNNPIKYNDPTGHNACAYYDQNGMCVHEVSDAEQHERNSQENSTSITTNTHDPREIPTAPPIIPATTPTYQSPQSTPTPSQTPQPSVCSTPPLGSTCASSPEISQYDPEAGLDIILPILDGTGATLDGLEFLGVEAKGLFWAGVGIDIYSQLVVDLNVDLSPGQRLARAGVKAAEGIISSVFATTSGAGVIVLLGGPENPLADVAGVAMFAAELAALENGFDVYNEQKVFPFINQYIP
jgi:RHS repeat-associated protein